jgi:hypothetical protein
MDSRRNDVPVGQIPDNTECNNQEMAYSGSGTWNPEQPATHLLQGQFHEK